MFMLTYNLHNLCNFLFKYCRSVNICDKCTSPKHLTVHPFQSKLPSIGQNPLFCILWRVYQEPSSARWSFHLQSAPIPTSCQEFTARDANNEATEGLISAPTEINHRNEALYQLWWRELYRSPGSEAWRLYSLDWWRVSLTYEHMELEWEQRTALVARWSVWLENRRKNSKHGGRFICA